MFNRLRSNYSSVFINDSARDVGRGENRNEALSTTSAIREIDRWACFHYARSLAEIHLPTKKRPSPSVTRNTRNSKTTIVSLIAPLARNSRPSYEKNVKNLLPRMKGAVRLGHPVYTGGRFVCVCARTHVPANGGRGGRLLGAAFVAVCARLRVYLRAFTRTRRKSDVPRTCAGAPYRSAVSTGPLKPATHARL